MDYIITKLSEGSWSWDPLLDNFMKTVSSIKIITY